MKTIKFLTVVSLVMIFVSCANNGVTKKELKTEIDSVSYAIGLDMSDKLKKNFEDVDKDLFLQGYQNGVDSTNLLLNQKEVGKIIRDYFTKKQKADAEKRKAEAAKLAEEKYGDIKKEGEAFLATNKTKKGVKTTASGLQYIVLKEGKGATPKATDRVKVHYHGTLIDGTVFDSSVDRGKPSEFGVSQVIKGWTEGLQLMKVGSKYKFFIPQELAYGATPRGGSIKPFMPLIFEVELLEVK